MTSLLAGVIILESGVEDKSEDVLQAFLHNCSIITRLARHAEMRAKLSSAVPKVGSVIVLTESAVTHAICFESGLQPCYRITTSQFIEQIL